MRGLDGHQAKRKALSGPSVLLDVDLRRPLLADRRLGGFLDEGLRVLLQ